MSTQTTWTRCRIAPLTLAASLFVVGATGCVWRQQQTLPARLSDQEFWRLSTGLSEAAGVFRHSDNLVSNEDLYAHTIRLLRPRGGVYIGVGPEQNFSYIARLQPAMAFIVDIREENRNLHLMYKALFETSADRAEFVSRLFSRNRPEGLGAGTDIHELFAAIAAAAPSASLHEATIGLVHERLLERHRFALSPDDIESIDRTFNAFYTDGPGIHYGRSRPKDTPGPSYHALMTATDARGVARSYLASEDAFAFVKDLHARNLIVPVVGDFAGPDAIRRVGDYVRQQGSLVSAFYSSNVEVYLSKQQMAAFCVNLRALPSESRTWFIRSKDVRPLPSKWASCPPLAP